MDNSRHAIAEQTTFNGQVAVLQLISSGGLYGAENVLLELATELTKTKDYTPTIGVIENRHNPHREVAEEAHTRSIKTVVFSCGRKVDLKTIVSLRRYVLRGEVRILHSHGFKSNLYALLATQGLSRCLVATCHNWLGSSGKMKFYGVVDRFMLRFFDGVVAVSEEVKCRVLASGVPSEKVRMIGNGISVKRFSSASSPKTLKASLGIPDNGVVIGTVGRLSEEKGHRYLLLAGEDILKMYPNTFMVIVGEGPLRQPLQERFVSSNIIFTGPRQDIPDLLRIMDVFVLPSLTEGLPMALLEAMASELPVVATAVGEVPRLVHHGKSGFTVNPGDTEALRSSMELMLANPDVARQLGKEGRRILQERFSSDKMAADYLSLYERLTIKAVEPRLS